MVRYVAGKMSALLGIPLMEVLKAFGLMTGISIVGSLVYQLIGGWFAQQQAQAAIEQYVRLMTVMLPIMLVFGLLQSMMSMFMWGGYRWLWF